MLFIWFIVVYCIGIPLFSALAQHLPVIEEGILSTIERAFVGLLWPIIALVLLLYTILHSIGWLGEKIDEKLSGTKDETQSPFAPYPRDHPPAPTE